MGEYRKSNKKKNRNGNFDAGSEKHAADQPNDRYSKFAVRKPVDPETTKYFTEIANLFESNGVEMEERAMICGNALEETAGKEFQLATDYVISHTLEMLLEGCSVDRLCAFLQGCANDFAYIATDKCGSFVAESAFRSLSFHLQEGEEQSLIEDTVTVLCKVMVEYPGDVMTDCHGSHVLRALIYLCKGMPIVSVKSEGAKPSSMALAERLNFKTPKSDDHASAQIHEGFPDLLKFLISEIMSCTEEYMKTSQIDQFCSLVLQAALKVLVGDDDELLKIIPVLLGCKKEDPAEGNYLDSSKAKHVVHLMKETAYSHLMEVILEVAPESLYNEIFTKVFGNSLFELSTHQCGNFVVQALVSHVQQQDHMDLIWEELGHKFKDIIGMGKPGVVASIVAASQRLHAYDQKCCQALVSAVSSTNESSDCVVPRFLFLDGYLFSKDKANWSWPRTLKMHVIGSLILQQVFRYPTAIVQPFITSILSLNSDEVLQTAKDAAGARVFEAFLNSDVSVRLKRRLVSRLQGNFGALAMIMSGSFTVEKCFSISNASIQESIVSELSAVRNELSKTRHGPHLIRKLDVEGFAARPDQWRSRQASKQSAYQEFYDTFGSGETKPARNDDVPPRNDRLPPRNTNFLSDGTKKTQQQEGLKKMREEINESLSLPVPFLSNSGFNRKSQKSEKHGKDHKGKYTGKNDSSAGKSERKRPSGDIPFLSHKKSKT